MKKQECCELEAIGISYKIKKEKTAKPQNPFTRIFSTRDEEEEDEYRYVLKDVNCRAKPWEILAIVGPSGAGKSTLLEVLAGRLMPESGSIYVNKKTVVEKAAEAGVFKKISGYVTQNDTLFPLLTVEETLTFSAKLRSGSRSQSQSRVDSLIEELGLSHVARARVGDDKNRGISGGERRRVSIGVEVIHDPKLVILDEPTSGLDSTSALQIIDMLKSMAEMKGRTVILSIHQPGFRIVKLFNSILLLANGSVLHHGTLDLLALRILTLNAGGGLQLTLPVHINVVEFAIDSIETIQIHMTNSNNTSAHELKEEEMVSKKGNNDPCSGGKSTLQQLFQQSKVEEEDNNTNIIVGSRRRKRSSSKSIITTNSSIGFANSRIKETIILSHRFSKNIFRSKELFLCRTFQMAVSGVILGSIFYNLKQDLNGAEERVGLFAFILTFLLTTSIEGLPIFLQERDILMKETSCGSYRVSSYAIANAIVYSPFLLILALLFTVPVYWLVGLNIGFFRFLLLIWLILYTANSVVVCFSAMVPNFMVGNSVISGVMGSFFLFSGYFISKKDIPGYWMFMHYLSLFKYPFEGFMVNEFYEGEKCLEYMFGGCVVRDRDVLIRGGIEISRWKNVVIMVCFIFGYRFIAYVILRCRCRCRCRCSHHRCLSC